MNRLSCSQLSCRRDSSPLEKKKKRRSGQRGACVLLQVAPLEFFILSRDCAACSRNCSSLCAVSATVWLAVATV